MLCGSLLLSLLALAGGLPLQLTSLITLRTPVAPKPSGGNQPPPPTYSALVLEEWNTNGLVQTWDAPCTLPGLSAETWTEGRLSPRYPYGDQIWFLCRNVPMNSSLSYSPAPVSYVYLDEGGTLGTWVEEPLYPNGTNLITVLPYWDEAQNLNVFYLLGGGTSSQPARPAQARIRVDTGSGQPPDAQGALLSSSTGITINQLRILNHTLYGVGTYGSAVTSIPAIYQVGSIGSLPTGTRSPSTLISNFPLVLSVWTDPFSSVWWRTGFNRTAYLARHNNDDGSDAVFSLPPSASAGTLGGASWSVATGRQEGSDFAIYLTNTTHLVKNTYAGLQNGLPFAPVLQAPPGWRYLSAHARNPNLPTPSATPTASASASASSSPSATSTASPSATSSSSMSSTPTLTPTPTAEPTWSSSPSPSASPSSYPSSTPTASRDPAASLEPSATSSPSVSAPPSTTPSNGTNPLPPPDAAQTDGTTLTPGEATGISLGVIGAFCIAGLLLITYSPAAKLLWIRQFGQSMGNPKKGVSFRSPVTQDVPITISHNPQILVQQRLDQLKELQKQMSVREISQAPSQTDASRVKKEFRPTVMGESV